jgi:hypothetical protein
VGIWQNPGFCLSCPYNHNNFFPQLAYFSTPKEKEEGSSEMVVTIYYAGIEIFTEVAISPRN